MGGSKDVKPIEYFIDKIINFDCLKVMPHIPDKSIDMILCDLPYGTTACKWDTIISFDPLWEQYKRIIKDHGAIVLFGSEPFSSHLRLSNLDWFKYDWIWKKNYASGFAFSKYQPMRDHEIISCFSRGKTTYYPQEVLSKVKDRKTGKKNGHHGYELLKSEHTGDMVFNSKSNPDKILRTYVNPRTVLEFDVVPRSKGTLHPTQKPVPLFEYLIKTYTNEGDIVLDNCIGSGTTALAARNTNRRWIGIELDKNYCEIARKRLEEV